MRQAESVPQDFYQGCIELHASLCVLHVSPLCAEGSRAANRK